jgi:hypothetical protein
MKIKSNLSDEFCNIKDLLQGCTIYIDAALEEYEKWGPKIIYGKMEYLDINHSEELQINGNTVPTVKQLYLVSVVQENGSSDLEIDKKD